MSILSSTLTCLLAAASASLVLGVRIGDVMFEKEPELHLPDGVPSVKQKLDYFKSYKSPQEYLDYINKQSNSPLDLGPATERIYNLGQELPQLVRCDKFYKLFESDSYRTADRIDELLSDNIAFDSVEQRQANLQAKLTAETNFDALNHIRTLYVNHLAEGVGLDTTLDMNVQQDLLECTQQYLSRHLRALEGVNEYIWAQKDKMPAYKGQLESVQTKFKQQMAEIKAIEHKMDTEDDDEGAYTPIEIKWLRSLYNLNRLVRLVSPIVPEEVELFVADARRQPILADLDQIQNRVDRLKREVLDFESDPNIEQARYKDTLMELYRTVQTNKDWLETEATFLSQPKRQATIQGGLHEHYEEEDTDTDVDAESIDNGDYEFDTTSSSDGEL